MRVAIVTGANKGIGFGIVELLARHLGPTSEWHIYLTARDEKRGLEAVRRLREKGLSVRFHQLDITESESRHKLYDFMKTNYPNGINILINNAGILREDLDTLINFAIRNDGADVVKMDSTVESTLKNEISSTFGEAARKTVATNYTGTVQMCLEFLPLMANNGRLVNVASMTSMLALHAMSPDLATQFKNPQMSLQELDCLMSTFVKHAEVGDHKEAGFADSAYAMSKVGIWKATAILADQIKLDPRHILMNSCCPGFTKTDLTSGKGRKTILEGADTPFYLATLPEGETELHGKFVENRKIINAN